VRFIAMGNNLSTSVQCCVQKFSERSEVSGFLLRKTTRDLKRFRDQEVLI
jgi:hypothetical protein